MFAVIFVGIRTQAAVGNKQFLRSMIPNHSGAVLMCERASIDDPEIVSLCGEIRESQSEQIAQIEVVLQRL